MRRTLVRHPTRGVVGEVVGRVYYTTRQRRHIYWNVPCPEHGRCPGFCFSTRILEDLKRRGVELVVVRHEGKEYLVRLDRLLKGAPVTDPRTLESQRGLPLHEFAEV